MNIGYFLHLFSAIMQGNIHVMQTSKTIPAILHKLSIDVLIYIMEVHLLLYYAFFMTADSN